MWLLFWRRKKRVDETNPTKTMAVPIEEEKEGCCPNCGSDKWYEGPSGGMSVNVKCAGCGLWFNNTPFGLDYIGIKGHVGEHKFIRWYCPHCKTVDSTEPIYGKYPHCPKCGKLLKVCWSYKALPNDVCDTCDARFPCFTERGNF